MLITPADTSLYSHETFYADIIIYIELHMFTSEKAAWDYQNSDFNNNVLYSEKR